MLLQQLHNTNNRVENTSSMEQADLVIGSQAIDISFLQDLDRPVLMYLGEGVFDVIKVQNKANLNHYYFVKLESPEALSNLIKSWDLIKFRHPVKALFIHDQFTDALVNLGIHTIRLKSSFRSIPWMVLSLKKTEALVNLCYTITADDYIYDPIVFPMLISKVSFARRLKRFGVTKQDAILKKDKNYKMYFLKRIFDILVSGTALLIASPIMIIVAIIIKLESKGPVFYISKRAGNYYKVFDFYKFRSMRAGADKELQSLKETSNQYQDGDQFVKIKDDPRVTRFGNFIRNTSLDELPQLINVLKGDMSVVGNRPLPLYEAELLITDDHAERFLAPAGITGLWQTLKRGKSDMSSEERIALDRIYVRKNSIWFDVKLIFMTIPALMQSEKV